MEQFAIQPKLYFGDRPLEALLPLTGKRVLIVTDAFLAASELLERVRAHLQGCVLDIFDEVEPDPSLQLVARGIRRLHDFQPDAIVAFGGGSPMDCAKAMRYFAARESSGTTVLFCIPTTAGTGSEVTSFAVLTDTEQGIKYPLVDDTLLPEAAILDPSFLMGLPPSVTADTGMDVLAHAAEALVARGASPFSDALAEAAFARAFHALPEAYGGSETAKAEMLYASCMAGLAFNTAGLGACHALAHSVGGRFHLPHGRINALLLPAVILFNAQGACAAERYAKLAKRCGLPPNARALSSAILRLRNTLGIASRIEIKMSDWKAALPALAKSAFSDLCMKSNPRLVTTREAESLLRELGG